MNSDLINKIDKLVLEEGVATTWRRSIDFMIAYLSDLKSPLPDVAERGLNVARKVRIGHADASELERARIECWKYLSERSASTETTSPLYCGVRAVICVLWDNVPQGGDVADLLDFFLLVANRFEDRSDMIEFLFQKFILQKEN